MMTTADDAPLRVAVRALSVQEYWFAEIDGRLVDVHGRAEPHPLHVVGIHRAGDELWIQLAPLAEWDYGMVIHCRSEQSPDAVVAYVRVLLQRGARPQYVECH